MIERHFSREPVYTPLLAEILSVKHDAGADGIDVLVKSGSKKTTIRIKNPPEGLKVGDTIRFSPKGMTQIPVGSVSAFARYGEAELMGGERREKPKASAAPARSEKAEVPRPAPLYPPADPKNMFGIYEAAEEARVREDAKKKGKKEPEKKPVAPAEPGSGIGWNSTHTQFFWPDFGDHVVPNSAPNTRYDEVLGENVPIVEPLSADATKNEATGALRARVEALTGKDAEKDESEESFESGPETYVVDQVNGKCSIRMNGTEYPIGNAQDKFLLPGDRVTLALPENPKKIPKSVLVDEVVYEGEGNILARIVHEKEDDPTSRLILIARLPDAKDLMGKFKFSAEGLPAQELFDGGKPFIFDRIGRKIVRIVTEPMTPYEEARRGLLIRNNIENPELEKFTEQQKREVNALYDAFGIPHGAKGKAFEDAARPMFEAHVKSVMERSGGRMKDFFSDPTRTTFYIDPGSSTDHDDAFSLRPLREDEIPEKNRTSNVKAKEDSNGEWYELAIHIARPDMLAPAGSALDRKALLSATSTYMPGDEAIRMFSPIISEHLGSLHENELRFALSFVCKVRLGKNAAGARTAIEIREPSLEETVVKVTEGISYQEADDSFEGKVIQGMKPESASMLALAREMAVAIQARTGTLKEPKKQGEKEEKMDASEMVATFMETYNRAMVMITDRSKKSHAPNVHTLQQLVLPIYRNRIAHAARTESFIRTLVSQGILTEEDVTGFGERPRSKPETVQSRRKRLLRLAEDRIRRGGREGIETDSTGVERFALSRFTKANLAAYFGGLREFGRNADMKYGKAPEGHTNFPNSLERVTSPLRRYPDLFAAKSLLFMKKLNELSAGLGPSEDIPEEQVRDLAVQYAEKIVGIRIPKSARSKNTQELLSYVQEKTEAYANWIYTNSIARENASKDTEEAMVSIETAGNLEDKLAKGSEIKLPPDGLSITFSSRNQPKEGIAYGIVTITSRKENRELRNLIPRPFGKARLSVQFVLPDGAPAPHAVSSAGTFSLSLPGAIRGIDVQKGRIVYEVDPNKYSEIVSAPALTAK